jgi:hypothetical protein
MQNANTQLDLNHPQPVPARSPTPPEFPPREIPPGVPIASLQGLRSDLTEASKAVETRTVLAKRIIEMADQGLTDVPELRDDALAFLQHNPPSADRKRLR